MVGIGVSLYCAWRQNNPLWVFASLMLLAITINVGVVIIEVASKMDNIKLEKANK
jgi:hypothetical protein